MLSVGVKTGASMPSAAKRPRSLDQHDPCLPERLRCLTARSLLTLKVVPGRIDERVERRRRDLQRITGLDLS